MHLPRRLARHNVKLPPVKHGVALVALLGLAAAQLALGDGDARFAHASGADPHRPGTGASPDEAPFALFTGPQGDGVAQLLRAAVEGARSGAAASALRPQARGPAPPVVPAEYRANVDMIISGQSVVGSLAVSSARRAAMRVDTQRGGTDVSVVTLAAINRKAVVVAGGASCTTSQAWSALLLTQFGFLQAPGTAFNGTEEQRGAVVDCYFNAIGSSGAGMKICVRHDPPRTPTYVAFLSDAGEPAPVYEMALSNFTAASFGVDAFALPPSCAPYEGPAAPPVGLADGFESGGLAPFWAPAGEAHSAYEPGAVRAQRSVVRSGAFAANITVEPGAMAHDGGFGKATERAELDMADFPVAGREVYYGFSMLLPADFPVVDRRLVVAQWKQSVLDTQSPVLALRYRAGRFSLTQRNLTRFLDDGDEVEVALPPLALGRWTDVVLRVRWSGASDAAVQLWLNGTVAAALEGMPTLLPDTAGYVMQHVGLYRDSWPTAWSMFLDNVAVGASFADVDPAGPRWAT